MASEADDDFIYSYGIVPLSAAPRSGWCLRLYEHHITVAEQHFPTAPGSLAQSMNWWYTLNDVERTEYTISFNGIVEAYNAYLVGAAYAEAETVACAWLDAHSGS
ncbi:hypothetical protein OU994_17610 [Pseudoduganella sp. SL102]|uniref:hypothetical protein n=1 Tax=Pseudoduganella sp. SL102 TaxID=2995154 RepID=UPI00248C98FF|nr:hypothetical protein [Pseudoduganella sp. SL102]WBS00140.1 hypothetical protein OU994_17610 [Pseudoduganella sp. SL102]